MLIPKDELPEETLVSIIQAFIMREGTDYGEVELSMAQKEQLLRGLIDIGEIVIVFDEQYESVNLMTKANYECAAGIQP